MRVSRVLLRIPAISPPGAWWVSVEDAWMKAAIAVCYFWVKKRVAPLIACCALLSSAPLLMT